MKFTPIHDFSEARHNSFEEAKNFSQFRKLFMLDQLSEEFLGQNKNFFIQNYDVEFLGKNKYFLIQNYDVEYTDKHIRKFLLQL